VLICPTVATYFSREANTAQEAVGNQHLVCRWKKYAILYHLPYHSLALHDRWGHDGKLGSWCN
jgi:hypothetical protein